MDKCKKMIALLLCLSMVLSLAACNSGSSSNGATEDTSFSWWIFQGEDSSYYSNYRDNPSVNYLLSKTWGPDNKKVELEFLVPAGGVEKDNCVTLIGTGEYPDLMDLSVYPGSIAELYEDGIALDITEYVETYMPNYLAFLDANPNLKATAMNVVNGKKMYLGIYDYAEDVRLNWGGYMYRRDWIVKYGKNPTDGSTFSGAYSETKADGTPNIDTWVDNVVFPSGGSDPIYISDWEWMLDIFQTAVADQGITDGYPMSLYYPGVTGMGELICGFGGAGTGWYKTPDGKVVYGGDNDNFRAYLQCMNTWYKNGWIDTAFAEHATDQFYAIDDTKVRSGKVGLWWGQQNEIGGRLDSGEGFVDGIVVFGAPQPINDIYGTAAQQNVEPFQMYQQSMEGSMTMITDKAKDKDLAALFSMLDYAYSEEGCLIKSLGLSKSQYEETKDEFYTKQGLTEGAYVQNEDGSLQQVDTILKDGGTLASAVKLNRLPGLMKVHGIASGNTEVLQHNLELWNKYKDTGTLTTSFISQLTSEEAKTVNKIQTNVTEFSNKNVPNFVKGVKDPYNDVDWNAFVKAMAKYNPNAGTQIYQKLLDSLTK